MATTMRPRPTTYKGVQMRSRLEAGFARWLDHMKTPWTYEPRAFTAIDGWQYLPDFQIDAAFHERVTGELYVEVKPSTWSPYTNHATAEWAHRAQNAIADNGTGLLLLAIDHPSYGGLFWFPGSATEMMPVGVSPGVADEDVGLGFYLAWNERPWIGEWWKGGA